MLSMNKNRGTFLEDLINRSCDYLWKKKIGFATKRFTKVHISKIKNNKVTGFLASKNYVDYYGQVNGQHIEFEAKTTKLNKFYFKNIKPDQINFLVNLKNMGSEAFFIIYFYSKNVIVKVNLDYIHELMKRKVNFLEFDEAIKKGKKLAVIYPGIIRFWD